MKKKIRLMPRDHLVFEHFEKFEVTTKKALWLAFFEGRKMMAVDSLIRRLDSRGVGYIHGVNLLKSRTTYFRLTKSGAKYLGIEINTKSIRIARLFTLMGKLYFINRPPKNKQRVLCDDNMLAKFIDCKDLREGKIRPPRVDFYISQNKIEDPENSGLVLGATLPDLNAKVDRVVDRCVKHSENLIKRGWFVDVMRAGRFEWTVLTGPPTQATRTTEGPNDGSSTTFGSTVFPAQSRYKQSSTNQNQGRSDPRTCEHKTAQKMKENNS